MGISLTYVLVISQHLSIELEFSVVLGDVAGGISNGSLGQQFRQVSGACLLTVELMLFPMKDGGVLSTLWYLRVS